MFKPLEDALLKVSDILDSLLEEHFLGALVFFNVFEDCAKLLLDVVELLVVVFMPSQHLGVDVHDAALHLFNASSFALFHVDLEAAQLFAKFRHSVLVAFKPS